MRNHPDLILFLMVGFSSLLSSCSPSSGLALKPTTEPISTPIVNLSPYPTTHFTPIESRTQEPSPLPTPLPDTEICSPLEGILLGELSDIVFNPFNPPQAGSDDPHQGVDFSDIDPVSKISLEGRFVKVVLEGIVAAVINDRFPYGNAIIIETTLNKTPVAWLRALDLSILTDRPLTTPKLTCPETDMNAFVPTDEKSLFLLYSHLKDPVSLRPDEQVSCGQVFGQIGNSGNSLNPHLHLEARIGPAGIRFESLAHYDSSASPDEMAKYCLWRVSGQFSPVNLMELLLSTP